MRCCPFLFCILLGWSALATAGSQESLSANPYALDNEKACGPFCVAFLDRYLGGSKRYVDILEVCPPGALGISVTTAESALQALGYYTRSIHISADALKDLRWPCMIYEQDSAGSGHFLVCTRWQPEHGTFQIFNPPRRLEEMTVDQLAQHMGGPVIVVSQTPLPAADRLVPSDWSWKSWLGIEVAAIGVSLFIIGCVRSKAPKSPSPAGIAGLGLLTMLLLCGCFGSNQHNPMVQKVEEWRRIDLGKVIQGTDLKATFRVCNESSAPFKIERIERSCQCQNVRFNADQLVLPHGAATVDVIVPTKDRIGLVAQELIVHTTAADKDYSAITLSLKADVRAPIRAIPSQIMFGSVSGDGEARQLRIETDPPQLAAKYLSATSPKYFKVELLGHNRNGLLFNVHLLPKPPIGILDGDISIRFDIAELSELRVPVRARKTGPIRAIPAILQVDGRRSQQMLEVLLAATDGQPFRLLSTTTPEGATSMRVESESSPLKRHLIKVLFTRPAAVAGKTVTIKTDLPEMPALNIPVSVINLP